MGGLPRDFMLAAVELGGPDVLQYASLGLRSDKRLIFEALERGVVDIFQHVSCSLRDDADFMRLAVELHLDAIKYLSPRLQTDDAFIDVIKQNGVDCVAVEEGTENTSKRCRFV